MTSTSANGHPTGGALSPHDFALRVATWTADLNAAGDARKLADLAERLATEPDGIRARLLPILKARRDLLEQPADASRDRHWGRKEASLDWVPDTLRLVLRSAERVRDGEPGATGLIPLGFLRDGGDILANHRVVIRDRLKGNRTAIFAQSGKGKTNLVKVVLFWIAFNRSYGKLIYDYKGEYVPWTQNERGEDVPGLCEHPLARDRVVLYTTKERHLNDRELHAKATVRRLAVRLQSILPRDFALFWPNLTSAQSEFLFTYDEDASMYDAVLGDEKEWSGKLGAWFGEIAAGAEEASGAEGTKLEASGKRVVRNVRRKLQAAQHRSYILDSSVSIDQAPDGWLVLHTPFDRDFVEGLKADIPGRSRRWDGTQKVWIVEAAQREVVDRLVQAHFGDTREDSLSLIGKDLSEGKLVVVDFSGIASEADRDLIATLVTRRQFEYNLARIDLDEGPEGRIPLVAFFEEAQNLLGGEKVRDSKSNIFVRTFKEGRALSIGTTSVTQQPSALSRDLTSQIAYYIVQHLRSHGDVKDLVGMDPALEGAETDIARRVPGNALYVDDDRPFPLPVKIDRFDAAFVEAVRTAYQQVVAEAAIREP